MISDSFFGEHEDQKTDLLKTRANRISKLFPLSMLACSFLLKSQNYKLSKDELFERIIQFPQVRDARRIFISPSDTRLFGFQDYDFFQVPIKDFINLTPEELSQNITNEYCNFNISPTDVWLAHPPNVDINMTLISFRHLFPQINDKEFLLRLQKPIFAVYFHYHKLDIDFTSIKIPPLQPPESFFHFDRQPLPEHALLSIFLANRTDILPLLKIQEIKRHSQITIGFDERPIELTVFLGDIVDLISSSYFFEFVDDKVQAFPPLFFDSYFSFSTNFTYQASGTPCLIRSPVDNNTTEEEDDSTTVEPAVTSKISPYIEKLMADVVQSEVPRFTFAQIFQHVSAQYIGFDQNILTEDAKIPLEEIKLAILKWIQENAQRDIVSTIQSDILKGEGKENKRLMDNARELLDSRLSDRRTDDLTKVLWKDMPFLRPDSNELEYDIEADDDIMYKLKDDKNDTYVHL